MSGTATTTKTESTDLRRKTNVMSKTARHRVDAARIAVEGLRSYYAAHPGSPAAVRRPALSIRRGLGIALVGQNAQEEIVGVESTVEEALRAFEKKFLAGLRPPGECHRH